MIEESPVAVAVIDVAIRSSVFRGTMQELLQALAALRPSNTVRIRIIPETW